MIWYIIYIVLLYILLLIITPSGYYYGVPSWIPTYPNNQEELTKVIEARKGISQELVRFHKRTDPSVSFAFYDFFKQRNINYPLQKLQNYIIMWDVIIPIHVLKFIHNRKRPYQYIPGINLPTKTAYTPSYPAGHAYQAYTLAKILGREYPQYRSELIKLAEKCDYVRTKAGLHYPSDGEYSRWLVGI